MKVTVDASLASSVTVGALRLSGILLPEDNGDCLWQKAEALCAELTQRYKGLSIGQMPGIARARKLYRSIGIDPTKNRPSSEALLRRLLKGKSLYRIHPLVDLFNMVSVAYLTPTGLYDESKIVGDTITVRIGGPGEGYDGIRKDRVNVEGRFCIADDLGPFGSPTSDSLRTSVEGSVTDAWAIFFQHVCVPTDVLEHAVEAAVVLAKKHLRAEATFREIIRG